ncbi:hypothetical protein [Roseitranquillus sediminis]|uniref:hypothetical protein n=1 Tax=Roseitranquillus sediminis TaxID=2809051 RepID=UPI001D0C0984|nr:hypothetical protein [Roseitranquillus sediminis]MBM9595302.1 hypothetical protein [Roseitranquillus sediminis]
MADYRDPKVTTTRKSGASRWIWIALAVLVVLLLLWWLFTPSADPVATDAVVGEEPAAVEIEPAAPAN